MYKKFYILKSSINILLMGLLCFYIFFDVINYVIAIMVLIILSQIIFKIITKFKFEKEAVKTKNNMVLNTIMLLSLWAGMYFNRFFIAVSWIAYVFTEVLAYREAQDYFD